MASIKQINVKSMMQKLHRMPIELVRIINDRYARHTPCFAHHKVNRAQSLFLNEADLMAWPSPKLQRCK